MPLKKKCYCHLFVRSFIVFLEECFSSSSASSESTGHHFLVPAPSILKVECKDTEVQLYFSDYVPKDKIDAAF